MMTKVMINPIRQAFVVGYPDMFIFKFACQHFYDVDKEHNIDLLSISYTHVMRIPAITT